MCATCPFGNKAAFDEKVFSLGVHPGNADLTTQEDAINSVEAGHDFMCHSTVYRDGLKKAPDSEWMLCKGGVLWRRGEI
jgi:hypothetical protein